MAVESEIDHNKLIAAAAKQASSPLGLNRVGKSRSWYDDHGWWCIIVEFQPSSWSRDTYLNIPVGTPVMSIRLLWLDSYAADPVTKTRRARANLISIHREKEPPRLNPFGKRERGLGEYRCELPHFLKDFKSLISTSRWDLIVEASSSKPHAKLFADAAREMAGETPSVVFSKRPGVSATTGATWMDIKAALSYEPHTLLGDRTRLLVVEDVFNGGKTVAAMISRLRDDGLSPETTTTVAVALYVPRAN